VADSSGYEADTSDYDVPTPATYAATEVEADGSTAWAGGDAGADTNPTDLGDSSMGSDFDVAADNAYSDGTDLATGEGSDLEYG